MVGQRTGRSREQRATFDLFEALGSSLDIRLVLERAYPALLDLIPADYGALGISSTGRADDYQWIVAKIPPAFFAAYPEMAGHDFVRKAVADRPNVVLRDQEMVGRPALEANMMYRRAREVGAPLEQVMAVMLHIDDRWQSGLSLYRERRVPFNARERATLQRVTPAIVNAVRSCHLFSACADWAVALDALLNDQGASLVLVAPPAREVARTSGAARLIDKWFAPNERRAGALPSPLADLMAQRAAAAPEKARALAQVVLTRDDDQTTLQVTFVPITGSMTGAAGMLLLRESAHQAPLPPPWRTLLTRREQEIAAAVLRGWNNQLIGVEVGCAMATVKKHLQNIFDKLGLSTRAQLMARARALSATRELGP